ncbi:MAG: hypothetical protein AAB638_01155, partial [Patescibacteria group bacterium]
MVRLIETDIFLSAGRIFELIPGIASNIRFEAPVSAAKESKGTTAKHREAKITKPEMIFLICFIVLYYPDLEEVVLWVKRDLLEEEL